MVWPCSTACAVRAAAGGIIPPITNSSVAHPWRAQKNLADPFSPPSLLGPRSWLLAGRLCPQTPDRPPPTSRRGGRCCRRAARRCQMPQKFVAAVLDLSARRFRRCALTFIRQPGGQPLRRERLQIGAGAAEVGCPLQLASDPLLHRRVSTHGQPNERALRDSAVSNFPSSFCK